MLALAELNESILIEIPEILQTSIISYSSVYTTKNNYSEIILTNGPILYEIRNKHILSSFDLSGTVIKGKQIFNIRET